MHHGHVTEGRVELVGQSILGLPSHRLVRQGMTQAPEGRMVFRQRKNRR